jgi:hypothetical protein
MRGWHVCRQGRARQDKSGFREIVACLTISTCCIVGKGEFGSDSSQLVTNLYRGANRASVRPILGFRPYRRLPVNCQLVNRLISVNDSFRHVGTIRLTLAPHPLEILSHLHGNQYPTCTRRLSLIMPNKIVLRAAITTFATPDAA